jgi:hypothetical protein
VIFGFSNLTKSCTSRSITQASFHKTVAVREHGVGDKGAMSVEAVLEVFASLKKA